MKTEMIKLHAAYRAGFLKQDILESYLPFLTTILQDESIKELKAELLQCSFEKKYGIQLPLTFVRSVLNVGVTKNLFYSDRRSGKFFVKENIAEYHLDTEDFDRKWSLLLREFTKYRTTNGMPPYEKIEEDVLSYIDGYEDRAFKINEVFRDDNIQGETFIWDLFVIELEKTNKELYEFVASLCLCNVVRRAEFFEGNASKSFSGLRVYLDTPIVFSLLGMDDAPRVAMCRYLVDQMNQCGCMTLVFDHCIREIELIISGAKHWIFSPDYLDSKASNAARYFFEKGSSEEEIVEFLETLEDKLKKYKVSVVNSIYDPDDNSFQEDESYLDEKLQKRYLDNDRILDEKILRSIRTDVRSIIFVYRNRRGYAATHLYDSRHLMLTFNSALIAISSEYEKKMRHGGEYIPPCISADTFGTVLWLHSPVIYTEFKKLKLLADCYAATNPSRELLHRFVVSLQRAKDSGNIDESTFVRFKASSIIRRPLALSVRGNVEAYSEPTCYEVIHRIEEEERFKRKKLLNEAHDSAQHQMYEIRKTYEEKLASKTDELTSAQNRASEFKDKSEDYERLFNDSKRRSDKLEYALVNVISFCVLFIPVTIAVGYLLGKIDIWESLFCQHNIFDYTARGLISFVLNICLFAMACVRRAIGKLIGKIILNQIDKN